MAATYRLRFFFDAGSGVCLWAANDAARSRFGYAVDAEQLPIPAPLAERLASLIAEYDRSIDWSHPPGPSPWDAQQKTQFQRDAMRAVELLAEALGADYEVVESAE